MQDMVFQGAFSGPPFWSIFFSDTYFAARAVGFEEVLYADDLDAWRAVPLSVPDAEVFALA
eukprot:4185535-Pyramimonas_sp.AAC.1